MYQIYVKQKGFYPYEYMSDHEKFRKFPSKEKLYSSLTDRKSNNKEYEHFPNFSKKFEMKMIKDYHDLHLKYDVLLLADVFENLEIIA